jgi:hypothetical protein
LRGLTQQPIERRHLPAERRDLALEAAQRSVLPEPEGEEAQDR